MGIIINPRQIIKDGITSLRDVWSSSKVSTELSGKQATLVSGVNIKTINGTSLLGSGDITISGGGDIPKINMTATTATLDPNKFYVWGEVASLDISLAAETAGIENIYKFQFQSGVTATTLTLPNSVKWSERNTPTIFRNTTYIISIESGIAKVERSFTTSLLPADYQQVEWIESDGIASIVIPFDFSQPIDNFELVFYPIIYSSLNADIVGSWPTNSSVTPGFGMQYSVTGVLIAWIGSTLVQTTPSSTTDVHSLSFEEDTKQWKYDGVAFASNYTQTSISQYSAFGVWRPCNTSGVPYSRTGKGKLQRIYLSTSNYSVELIPCYHRQSNIAGLYDIIHNTFYTNYQSSGIFTVGPDV